MATSIISMLPPCMLLLFLLTIAATPSSSQQTYPSISHTTDCTNRHLENSGYSCQFPSNSCFSLAYFRPQPPSLDTLSSIASTLFNTTPQSLAKFNPSLYINTSLDPHQGLFVPLYCSCSGSYFSYNVTNLFNNDLLVQVTNFTYEGLSTCQAVQDANPEVDVTNLQRYQKLIVPLRCACPTVEQRGVKLLITYPVADGDDISTIVSMFGANETEFLFANTITNRSLKLTPATTVLIPLSEVPTIAPNWTSPKPAPSPPHATIFSCPGTYVVSASSVIVFLCILSVAGGHFVAKQRKESKFQLLPLPRCISPQKSLKKFTVQEDLFASISRLNEAERWARYTLDELKQATQDFSPSAHIKGAVYRAVIKGQVMAVKVMTRDVTKELQILRTVHHVNLVALLGACLNSPDQRYLVYEYAEHGSLSDQLHDKDLSKVCAALTWNNRLQIAWDVGAALDYIHKHTIPNYVHTDVNSGNILLYSKFRGKLANFGMAKSTEEVQEASTITTEISGYMPPEYLAHGKVSTKMDVFAFGVVLLEILSGVEAMVEAHGKTEFLWQAIGSVLEGNNAKEKLKGWMDPSLGEAYPMDCAYSVAMLARSCVAHNANARPSMKEVIYSLAKLMDTCMECEHSCEDYINSQVQAR